MLETTCPVCAHNTVVPFYQVEGVPIHSVVLIDRREEALEFPQGDIDLVYCETCGFIFNRTFTPVLQEYGDRYEPTQAYSGTFNAFHGRLAKDLIERNDLYEKDVIEIGCGQGEFLQLLNQIGNNRGIGFDPAYNPERSKVQPKDGLSFVQDFYSEKYAHLQADFIVCKMTLEHIAEPAELLRSVRKTIGDRQDVKVFFQVPDMQRVLQDIAFWDIYYEHCSYFTPVTLSYLFSSCGFEVLSTETQYDNQYLMIEARPIMETKEESLFPLEGLNHQQALVSNFVENIDNEIGKWDQVLQKAQDQNERVVLWGSGSKAVAFLSTLKAPHLVDYAIDINPHKQGKYLPGTGHLVCAPEDLVEQKPDVIIAMNAIYLPEIQDLLNELNVTAQLLALGER